MTYNLNVVFTRENYYSGPRRDAILRALAEGPRHPRELVEMLLEPTNLVMVSRLLHQLADEGHVVHMDDSTWALLNTPAAYIQRVRDALRQPGVAEPIPLTTSTLCHITGMERDLVLKALHSLGSAVQRDSAVELSWWLRNGRVVVRMGHQLVELRLHGRVGQHIAQARIECRNGVYYLHDIPHLTLESAALTVLEQGSRMEGPANEDSPGESSA